MTNKGRFARTLLAMAILVAVMALMSSCKEPEPEFTGRFRTPTITGAVSLPATSKLSPSDIWVKVIDSSGQTKNVSRVSSDGSFAVSGLKKGEKYDVYFTSEEPEHSNYAKSAKAASSTSGFGGWLGEVDAAINDGNNVGSVKMKPLGTIKGNTKLKDMDEHYDIDVYIPGTSYISKTSEDGSWSIYNVPQGTYKIRMASAGYTAQMVNDAILSSESETENPVLILADKVLIKNVGTLKGKVLLDGKDSYSGTIVKLEGSNATGAEIATTSQDGSFSIPDVAPGVYSILAMHEGYVDLKKDNIVIKAAETTIVEDLTMGLTTSTVKGQVTLSGALSSEGISVMLKSTGGNRQYTSTTDQNGFYAFNSVAAGTYEFLASKDGYMSILMDSIFIETGKAKEMQSSVMQIAKRNVTGQIEMELKSDHSGVQVTATNLSDHTLIYSALTNSEGIFSLNGMIAGEYLVSASYPGYETVSYSTISIYKDEAKDIGKKNLPISRGRISGLVKLEGYSDYSGVKVFLLGTGYETVTASDGSYEFNVPSGNYPGGIRYEKMDMETASYTSTISVLTGSTYAIPDVQLKALSVPVVRGQLSIKNATSVNFGGITVKLVEKPEFVFTTEDDGVWMFEHVPLGDYTLEITRENTRKVTMNISVEAAPEIVVEAIELIPDAASIEGNVTLKSVSDYSGVDVRAESVDGDLVKTTTNAAGYFYLGNILSSKAYTVYFEKAGWNSQSIEVSGLEPMSLNDITEDNAIELTDTTAPVLTDMTIIAGASVAEGRKVYVYADASDAGSGIKSVYVSTENSFDGIEAISYTSPFECIMPDIVGEQALYAKLVDNAGNESVVISKAITLKSDKNEVKGVLTGSDLTWTKEKSPYYVTGNILVEEGQTLTIEPGVNVQFAGAYYIVVDGTLKAIGSEDDKILMYGVGDGEDSWLGINVRKDYVSVIENATIFGLARGLSGKMLIQNSSVASSNTNYCLGYDGGWNNELPFAGTIESSVINGEIYSKEATFVDNKINLSGTVSKLNESYLVGNSVNGLYVILDSSLSENNIFEVDYVESLATGSLYSTYKNAFVYIYDGGSYNFDIFENCDFQDFSGTMLKNSNIINCGVISTDSARTSIEEHDFSNNFWGYDKTTSMDVLGANANHQFIYDYYDDFDLTKIKLEGYAKEPHENIGYQGDAYYSDEESEIEYKVGDIGPAGGCVFYDKGYYSAGWRYLEAAPNDIGQAIFGCYRPTSDSENLKSGTSVSVGAGCVNTLNLVATIEDKAYSKEVGSSDYTSNYAAKLCYDYEINGYDDWFLPSRDELNQMYEKLHKNGIGSFSVNIYWSSSESNPNVDIAWFQYFFNGNQGLTNRVHEYYIRPCRAF